MGSLLSATVAMALGLVGLWGTHADPAAYSKPTYSSPIAISIDDRLVWSVNPNNDSVSVIRTDTNQLITAISVGHEPQSIALTPNNKWAYVANAADGTVTVIGISNPDPNYFSYYIYGALTTGAEPWNIVVSPDGNRVFVANSSQDTITVIRSPQNNIIGNVDLRGSVCNAPDPERHFQPRGLAVTQDNSKLYVTRFLSYTEDIRAGGKQGSDEGKEGLACQLSINTTSTTLTGYHPVLGIPLASQPTGFLDLAGNPTSAFPNQLQSIVIRGDQAYLPNIAASPTEPLHFDSDTMAFVSVIDGINGTTPADAPGKFLNLHLGARVPEAGKIKLFFANPWAIAFTNQSGPGTGYAVSAASDLLVKVDVAADGTLSFTDSATTTRYIDLNDPTNPATSGANAGKNPLGIVINDAGTTAFVMNRISRNVSVVDLTADRVAAVIKSANLPPPFSPAEVVAVGAEMFFSSRGHFDRPPGTTVSTDQRLAQAGWQACSSCHFQGLTDGVAWQFNTGPRKTIPLNGTFNPHDPTDQRVLNYSAIFDEIEDFELNIRNVSGPGPLQAAVPCSAPAPGGPSTSTFDPNHGLLIGDNGNINTPPCTIVAFAKPNSNRRQVTVTLPGSSNHVPALTALKEWVKSAVRTPNSPFTSAKVSGGVSAAGIAAGRNLFQQAQCTFCHSGGKWTISTTKNFTLPPATGDIATETTPPPVFGSPVNSQYLFRALTDVESFNLNVEGSGSEVPGFPVIGAVEKATRAVVGGVLQATLPDALGIDYNLDGKGTGFNPASLLGSFASSSFLHNGACESLACVVADVDHRTANGTLPDVLTEPAKQALVVEFLQSIDGTTVPFY
jgi:YVTN family beta-propeller protein